MGEQLGASGESFKEFIYQSALKLYINFVKNPSLFENEEKTVTLIQLLSQIQAGATIHQWGSIYGKATELIDPLQKEGVFSPLPKNDWEAYLQQYKLLVDILNGSDVLCSDKCVTSSILRGPINKTILYLITDDSTTDWTIFQTDRPSDFQIVLVDKRHLFSTMLVQTPGALLLHVTEEALDKWIQFIKELRYNTNFLLIPIIAILDKKSDRVIGQLYTVGIDDIVIRPISSALFQIKIHNQLSRINRFYRKMEQMKDSQFDYLYSRSQIMKSINKEWSRFLRNPEQLLTLVSVRLDSSLLLLHEHGEAGLNKIFEHIVGIVSNSLRTSDEIARWDYDTIIMVLPNTDLSGANIVLQRIRSQLDGIEYVQVDQRLTYSTVQIQSHAAYQNAELFVQQLEVERKKVIYPASNIRVPSLEPFSQNPKPLDRYRILLLDPDLAIQAVLQNYLKSWELRAMEEHEDIYDLMYQWRPDIVITEIKVWDIDALLLCTHIRHSQFKNIGYVVLTNQTLEREKTRAFEVGVDDYVTKPFSVSELEARIKRLINRKQEGPAV